MLSSHSYFQTAHTLAFNLYNLAINPVVQRRLQEEIDQYAPRGTTLTHEQLQQMKYLVAVTKETSRYFVYHLLHTGSKGRGVLYWELGVFLLQHNCPLVKIWKLLHYIGMNMNIVG